MLNAISDNFIQQKLEIFFEEDKCHWPTFNPLIFFRIFRNVFERTVFHDTQDGLPTLPNGDLNWSHSRKKSYKKKSTTILHVKKLTRSSGTKVQRWTMRSASVAVKKSLKEEK